MSNTRKLLLFVFAIAVVINLQLSTPITEGMENGFSLEQLVENIFIPEAYATFNFCYQHLQKHTCHNGFCYFVWDVLEYCDNY